MSPQPGNDPRSGSNEFALAQAAVNELTRALRTLRTYPANNQISRGALKKLEDRLAAAPTLDLEVRPEHLCWQGEPLIEVDSDRSDLAGNLYKDGVRRLQIGSGIESDEVRRFVVALATPIHPQDLSEDYVTRLWEAELEHVRVAALDPFLALDLPEDMLEGKEKPGEEIPEIDRIQTDAEQREEIQVPPPPEQAFQIDPEDEARVAEEIAGAMACPPWGNFIAATFDVLLTSRSPGRVADLVLLIEQAFGRVLSEGRIEFANAILNRFRGTVPSIVAAELRQARDRMVTKERLMPLHLSLERDACDHEQAQQMLSLLGPRVTDSVCAFLLDATREGVRRFYADVLVNIGKASVEPVVTHLAPAPPVAQLHFARILGRLRTARATGAILEVFESCDPRVRRELIRTLATIPSEAARNKLLGVALGDPEARCRSIALRGLGANASNLDPKRLLERVESHGFAFLEDEEKDLLFEALGSVGGDATFAFLQRCLKPRWAPWSDRRSHWPRAARAVAKLGTGESRTLLEKLANGRNRELALICKKVLESAEREQQ